MSEAVPDPCCSRGLFGFAPWHFSRAEKAPQNSANTNAIATGPKKPSLASTPKIAAHEVGKQDRPRQPAAPEGVAEPFQASTLRMSSQSRQDSKGKANSVNPGAVETRRQR